jgi:hypothetical protein
MRPNPRYATLPLQFQNDPSGQKEAWRKGLREKLTGCPGPLGAFKLP